MKLFFSFYLFLCIFLLMREIQVLSFLYIFFYNFFLKFLQLFMDAPYRLLDFFEKLKNFFFCQNIFLKCKNQFLHFVAGIKFFILIFMLLNFIVLNICIFTRRSRVRYLFRFAKQFNKLTLAGIKKSISDYILQFVGNVLTGFFHSLQGLSVIGLGSSFGLFCQYLYPLIVRLIQPESHFYFPDMSNPHIPKYTYVYHGMRYQPLVEPVLQCIVGLIVFGQFTFISSLFYKGWMEQFDPYMRSKNWKYFDFEDERQQRIRSFFYTIFIIPGSYFALLHALDQIKFILDILHKIFRI